MGWLESAPSQPGERQERNEDMRIHDMFERDIDRNINGVIKIDQNSDEIIQQELEEYVVTRELRRHFSTFYDAYERALDVPTDKIGVWISGFFGSGKSHFLKMLSYLLSNRVVNGKQALGYIEPRFEDPMLAAKAVRAASVPTETILFNIDNKGSGKDETAVVRTFYRVFYENQGFYGANLKLARLESLIELEGKTEAFRAAYEQASGRPWLEWRRTFTSKSEPIIEALAACGFQTREEAERWYNATEPEDLSIDTLTNEIRDYAERRAREHNGQFRLLFMVDEVGQYIGGNTSLMLNLQSIVEGIASKCAGRVWVVVTGQEAIDEITSVASDDFSKIQGRFDTRLSLSSSDASEVIKRRVLAKTPDATQLLSMKYQENAAVLGNLFAFSGDTRADLTGYTSGEDFAQTFPFVNYQFGLMQNVMNELRKQGHSGKHLSSGERSMLSGFQEAAQAVENLDENALVPFWRFYDGAQTFLESYHRRVINRAAEAADKHQGLDPYDVNVLKLLFLVRWVERDVAPTIDNIVTLMTSDVRENRMELREQVQESLDRLLKQNYIARNGNRYQFLTDEEQEIANQIARTKVETAQIVSKAGDILFKEIFDTPKLTVDKNQFPVEEWLDATRVSTPGGLTLRVLACIDGSQPPTREELIMRSSGSEAIVLPSQEIDFFSPIMEAARIEQFTRTLVRGNLPANQQEIVRSKQQEKTRLEREASALLEQAIRQGEFYVQGQQVTPAKTSQAKKAMEECLTRLVNVVYSNLSLIDTNYDGDDDIRKILNGAMQALPGIEPNKAAVDEVDRMLKGEASRHRTVSMRDIQTRYQAAPYGWREQDIAGVVALLLEDKRAKLTYAGKAVDPRDSKCVSYLRQRSMIDKVQVEARIAVSEGTRARVRRVVEELCDAHNLPVEEDALAEASRKLLEERLAGLKQLIDVEYRRNGRYPGRADVDNAIRTLEGVLATGMDSADLLNSIANNHNELLNAAEDLEDVDTFFNTQQRETFDRAGQLLKDMKSEQSYLATNEEATSALKLVDEILDLPNPYRRIKELPEASQTVQNAYKQLLKAKRDDLLAHIENVFAETRAYANEHDVKLQSIEQTRLSYEGYAKNYDSLAQLDALRTRLGQAQSKLYSEIETERDRLEARHAAPPVAPTRTGASTDGGSAPTIPPASKPKLKHVSRSEVFKPQRLRNEAEVDQYLQQAREQLLRALEGNDAIQMS